ncbi:outer dynein arm-docking complex subunit 4-like [Gigantopelta aegis]|uniref:outer dynein arm-docking complex subunit 4-like n=1 Tax=Gigantopelta aegis TaxID=1735272 RepID=UPI001B888AD2|nr:outer dynein arm-docking complex subunit 4-like [Gigantopelta aegis]
MATRILPNIRREPTIQMKNRFLFDIYRREGEQFFFENKYKEAIDSYNAALEIDPGSKVALMARSRCYFEMGLVQRSLVDCEAVLAMENTYPDAVYQKAEIYYALENYEMALLFYHRGHKLGYRGFQEGIDRCKERVKHNESGRTMKLTPAGDLTIYVHKKMRKLSSTPREENKQKFGRSGKTRSLFRDPSVVSYKLNLSPNPLVRLDKKERARARSYKLANRQAPSHRTAANQRSYSDRPVNYRNETSNETRDKDEVIHSDRSGVKEGQGYYSPDEGKTNAESIRETLRR